jgi:hypothetical protein
MDDDAMLTDVVVNGREPDEDGKWHVEHVLDKRVVDGNTQYLVKWLGFECVLTFL